MKLNAKVSLLAGAIALAGVAYVPTAAATLLTPPTSVNIGQSLASSGLFTNSYSFSVTAAAAAIITANSSTSTLTLNGSLIGTTGVSLSSVSLWDGANQLTSANAVATGTGSSSFPGGYTLSGTAYGVVLNYLPLLPGHTYDIKISGDSINTSGAYAGSLTLIPAPVPEPEEWAMMLVGAGLVGYQVRRKQKALSQSIAA